jgi:hypothetical protein
MHRLVSIIAALVMLFALSATALGASPSQLECEAAGGSFNRSQGEVTCTFPPVEDPVGNSENSNGKSQSTTTTEEESSNGTLNNRPQHEESSECTGPGKGGSTAQCP